MVLGVSGMVSGAVMAGSAKWQGFRVVRAWAGALALTLMAGAVFGQGLPPELQQAWRATRLAESDVSIVVQELNGPRLVSINADQARNPASVMKMVTTWTALSGLGPEYRWRTAFFADGDGRPDTQGTLNGPLYLKAGGDPFLSVQELWSLLRELRLRGIKNLSEVVVDRSLFGRVAIDPGAFDNAPDRPYNASPDALMVGLGAVRLSFQPDPVARKWVTVIDPPSRDIRVVGQVEWTDQVCPGSPRVGAVVAPSGNGATIQVSGAAAGSCGEFSVYRVALTQPAHFETLFRSLWSELGGTLGKGFRDGVTPSRAALVAWHDSETLSDTIRHVNKYSNNVMARALLLTLGAEQLGNGATPQSGAQAAMAVLREQGVDTRGWLIDNGAGLSREARLTANGLAQMLTAAWNSPMMPEFMSSLAIVGVDGTVRRRLRSDEARGRAHLKTGTLRDVRAVAGYVMGASGKRYLIISMANGERATAIRPFDDALISWLSER